MIAIKLTTKYHKESIQSFWLLHENFLKSYLRLPSSQDTLLSTIFQNSSSTSSQFECWKHLCENFKDVGLLWSEIKTVFASFHFSLLRQSLYREERPSLPNQDHQTTSFGNSFSRGAFDQSTSSSILTASHDRSSLNSELVEIEMTLPTVEFMNNSSFK